MEQMLLLHPVTATNVTRDINPPKSPLGRKPVMWHSATKTIFKSTNALIATRRHSPIRQEYRKQPWRKWETANPAAPATTRVRMPSRYRMIAANATKCDDPPSDLNSNRRPAEDGGAYFFTCHGFSTSCMYPARTLCLHFKAEILHLNQHFFYLFNKLGQLLFGEF